MLNSNVITLTLQGNNYPRACRLLEERADILAKDAAYRRSDKSADVSPFADKVQEIERQLMYILGSAALDAILLKPR